MKQQRPGLVRVIGALKLLKAVVLTLIAVGLLAHTDARAWVWRFAGYVSERKLAAVGIGSAVYALVFFVEGAGLLALKSWAEWLTVIVTTSFIPIEIGKIVHHPTASAIVTLVLNIAVVIYLLLRIRQRRAHH